MGLDRRQFLQSSGAAAAMALTGASSRGDVTYGFVASGEDAIHVFAREGAAGWQRRHSIGSHAPTGLVLSRDTRSLYAGNAVTSFEGRPTGSVERYAVDWSTGELRLVNRSGLALFATSPESLAVSPNGRWLAVGLGGRAYNLLALAEDGSIAGLTAAWRRLAERPVARGGHVVFADDTTLVGMEVGGPTVLSVGADGSLSPLSGGVSGTAWKSRTDMWDAEAGLAAAALRAGVAEPRGTAAGSGTRGWLS